MTTWTNDPSPTTTIAELADDNNDNIVDVNGDQIQVITTPYYNNTERQSN